MRGKGRGRALLRLAVAAGLLIGAARASASPLISLEITGEDGIYGQHSIESEGTPNTDGTFNLTNLTAATQTFILNVTLPIPSGIAAPTVMGGYVGDIEYWDDSGDSIVTVAALGGDPLYQARIDGVGQQDLIASGNSLTAFGAPNVFGTLAQLTWGTPIPSAPGPAVLVGGDMSIRTKFSLTAGDRVSIPVNFVVEPAPVPEPGSLVLIGVALASVAGLRARRG